MKTISATFLAFAGMAWAVETQVFYLTTSVGASDSPNSPYFYDATNGCFTDNTSISGTVLSYANNQQKVQANISFVLNLTAAQNLESSTTLLKMDMQGTTEATGGDVGLSLTSSGVSGAWNEGTSGRQSVAYTTLLNDASVFQDADGNQCITLTMVQYASGVYLYSSSTRLWADSGLCSGDNTVLNSITVNTSYVEAVQFSTTWPANGDATSLNKTFDTAARTVLVPEPAAATLSLLALVGLAARRRRA